MFMSLRVGSAHQAAALSGMAQGVGYLLAACGPMLAGKAHDLAGTWNTVMMGGFVLAIVRGRVRGAGRPCAPDARRPRARSALSAFDPPRQPALAVCVRLGSFQFGRTKWQVYLLGMRSR